LLRLRPVTVEGARCRMLCPLPNVHPELHVACLLNVSYCFKASVGLGGLASDPLSEEVDGSNQYAEAFLRSRHLSSYSRISQQFMEPEGSLPCTQEPSTGPYR
jgi:hypothetical protein